jgi:Lar family restriction alleviation protein
MKKLCPFCGSDRVSLEQGSTFRWRRVECFNCEAIGPEARTDAQALEEWNTRLPDYTAKITELEQLLEATLKSHTEEQEMALKAEARVKELEGALRIAQAFCGKLTADVCPDHVAIPIDEALAGK